MISLRNVVIKDKKSDRQILNNVTLDVKEGDFVYICGKDEMEQNLLVSTLGLLETIDEGEILVDEVELRRYSPSQIVSLRRERFAYLVQNAYLEEDLTVKENVVMPLLFTSKDKNMCENLLNRALTIVGLMDFIDIKVKELSHWQKNKVLIARALVNEPKVLVMIEPFVALEPSQKEEVINLLSALNDDGVTIVIGSKQAEYKKIAKRKIEIKDGIIVEQKKERAKKEPETKTTKRKTTKKSSTSKKAKQVKEEKVEVKEIEPEDKQVVEKEEGIKPVKRTRQTKKEMAGGGEE